MTRRRSRSTRDRAKTQTTFNHEFEAARTNIKTYAEYSDFYSFSEVVPVPVAVVPDPLGDSNYWIDQADELLDVFLKKVYQKEE